MDFLTQVGVVLACLAGVLVIIGFISDYTCHSYTLVSRFFNTLYEISSSLAPLFLFVFGAYPIVLLIVWLITTYTNVNVNITITS